jgi:hypothetical protein
MIEQLAAGELEKEVRYVGMGVGHRSGLLREQSVDKSIRELPIPA